MHSNKILKIDNVWNFFDPMCFMAKSAGQNLRSEYRVSWMTIYDMIVAHSL